MDGNTINRDILGLKTGPWLNGWDLRYIKRQWIIDK